MDNLIRMANAIKNRLEYQERIINLCLDDAEDDQKIQLVGEKQGINIALDTVERCLWMELEEANGRKRD